MVNEVRLFSSTPIAMDRFECSKPATTSNPISDIAQKSIESVQSSTLVLNKNEIASTLSRNSLFQAIRMGDTEQVERLVHKRDQLNAPITHGLNPLHFAIGLKQHEVVKKLLHLGADPNVITIDGITPLHWAAARQDIPSVKYLLRSGGAYDPAIVRPKQQATIALVGMLPKGTCQPSRKLKLTPTITANPPKAQSHRIRIMKEIFSQHKPLLGLTMLGVALIGCGMALFTGDEYCLKSTASLLIGFAGAYIFSKSLGAAIDKLPLHVLANIPPLYAAVLEGDLVKIENLIQSGADIEAKDSRGLTALQCAAALNQPIIVEKLVALGANVHIQNTHGHVPLYLMLANKAFANTKALEAVIQASNGISQELIDRSLLANRFALEGASGLSNLLIELGGFSTDLAILTLKDAASSFYSPIIEELQRGDDKAWNRILQKLSPENRQRIDSLSKSKMAEVIKNSLEAVTSSRPENVDVILDRHANGLPVAIAISLPTEEREITHTVSLVVYGDKIARCDKNRQEMPGGIIYIIEKPKALRQALERLLSNPTEDYFNKEIVTELGLSQQQHFAQKRQKGPNCTIANSNNIGPMAMYMQLAPLVGQEAAEQFSKIFKRLNMIDTRLNNIRSYLNKHEQPLPVGFDVGLIGQLYSKKTGKPEEDRQIREMIEKWAAKRKVDLKAAVILGTVQAFLSESMNPSAPLPNLSFVSRVYDVKTGCDDIDTQIRSIIDLWAKKRNLEWQEV